MKIPPLSEFDRLADRFGCPEAKSLSNKERSAILRRWTAWGGSAQAFVTAAIRSFKTAQRRKIADANRERERLAAQKVKADRARHAQEMLRSLGKPVSRIAGQDEHLNVLTALPSDLFYRTPEWRRTRWEALSLYGRSCVSCGAVPDDHARLTATHIVERLVRPDLAFDLTNLRILCADCHIGQRALARPQNA